MISSVPVRYVSTRGAAAELDFSDVLLEGLATDGGLYVPDRWPTLPADLDPTAPYVDLAVAVMWPFVAGSIERADFERMVAESYATFDHPDVVPLTELADDHWLLELFHGPTLAFKDVALQLVGRLFDHELARQGRRVTIVGATSGDTGSAAIEACRDRAAIDIVILHPAGRVSDVQRRQMTTVPSANVHNVAVEGTFDDCQDMVKALFADTGFRQRVGLAAVNSINWARVMAQIVYYVVAALRLGGGAGSTSGVRPVSFCVPTGNFGNVFAGHGAMRMGLAVDRLVVASNRNDILTRFFRTGTMQMADVHPTIAPSMDIQVSSNFERLLFEMLGRDGAAVAECMLRFRETGTFEVDNDRRAWLTEHWQADRLDDREASDVMADVLTRTGVLLDPHSAIAVGAAERWRQADVPMVSLATAHPAKFPDAVEAATGTRPPLPDRLADLFERHERYVTLPNDLAALQAHVLAVTDA